MRRKDNSSRAKLKPVGILHGDDNVDVKMEDIIWPGNQSKVVKGVFISSHLRVSFNYIFQYFLFVCLGIAHPKTKFVV